MKRTITKILSILCLVAVLVCGFTMPFATLTGPYKEFVANFTGMFATMPEEQVAMMEQGLAQFGIELNIEEITEAFNKVAEPINDGQISMKDFWDISQAGNAMAESLNNFSIDGLAEDQLTLLEQSGMLGVMESFVQIGVLGAMVGYMALVPLGLFGLLALGIVIRIILRLFNRRGLGVLITIAGILNATFMLGIPLILEMFMTETYGIGAEPTYIPYIIIGGCVLSCILWAIGRGKKVKKVKEEVVVEVPVEAAPVVEETVEVVEETAPVEETPVEEIVEATEEVEE